MTPIPNISCQICGLGEVLQELAAGHGFQARQVERHTHTDDLQHFQQPGQDPGDRIGGRGEDLGGQALTGYAGFGPETGLADALGY
jgi:hypothetical protein